MLLPALTHCMILPPPSVVYCFGVFGLMMLSLLETILMMYLIGKDHSLTDEANKQGKAKGGESNGNKQGSECLEVPKLVTTLS